MFFFVQDFYGSLRFAAKSWSFFNFLGQVANGRHQNYGGLWNGINLLFSLFFNIVLEVLFDHPAAQNFWHVYRLPEVVTEGSIRLIGCWVWST